MTQGEICKETIALTSEQKEEPVILLEKPGAKLQKLRNDLQHKIAQRRSELWQQRQQLPNNDNDYGKLI